jgi:Fic/DOC family
MIEGRALEGIAIACVHECQRQQVGVDGVGNLLLAYAYAEANADRQPNEGDLLHLALLVEPQTGGRYRRVPVTFRDGGTAVPSREIPAVTARLFQQYEQATDGGVYGAEHIEQFVRALLLIHPFHDGNGRVAFVLRNWLRGSLEAPEPLPDYFGG